MYSVSALAALLIAAAASAQTTTESYAWPLDLPRELTSSFGEYRPGRYHMGIDLRTGPIGKDVHAAADGYVSRIRCSPYGYGKAVYIQLADGNSAVYAHLSDFATALRDYVRRAQHEREEYTVDLTPKPGEFPVKRGEVIAKSGQTGIGVPHLHYELRDKDGVAINPRLAGVTWPDTTAPIIESIAVWPLSPRSVVENDYRGTGYTGVRDDEGRIRMNGPVVIDGPVGFLVAVNDPAHGGSRLGVYRATLSIEGRDVFTVRNDRISYDHAEDAAIAFAAMIANLRYLRLWRVPGNDAEAYATEDADGAFELRGPSAKAFITVEDFSGNTTSLAIELRQGHPEAEPPPVLQDRGSGSAGFHFNGVSLVLAASFPGDELETPEITISGDRFERLSLRRMDARRFQAAYLPDANFADLTFQLDHARLAEPVHRFVFVRRGGSAHRFAFGDLEISTQPDTPYGVLAVEARPIAAEPDAELRALGSAYDLRPNDLPVDAPITLSLPLPKSFEHPERALIYRRDLDKKKWVRQDTEGAEGRVFAATRQLGIYALLEDASPPALELLRPAKGQTLNSLRPAIRARVIDLGSGIDAFRATYNGKWLLVEYDPEQDLLNWEQDEDLPAGAGTLAIEVRDHAGNATRREVALTLRSPAP